MTKRYEDVPLFPLPEKVHVQLSELYASAFWRSSPGSLGPEWKPVTSKAFECDECFARQHETRGESGSRHPARISRSFRGARKLHLCRGHEELWRTRDAGDITTESAGGGPAR